jgi:hypothetical protein
MVFWGEVHARYELLSPHSPAERFKLLASMGDAHQRLLFANLQYAIGHEIHGIRAKDTSDRWAYYHVYVQAEREKKFLEAIGSPITMELDDYGVVVASEFEHVFRERQVARARAHFRPLIEDYARLATRQRAFSISKFLRFERPASFQADSDKGFVPHPAARSEDIFKRRRFDSAVDDVGSREALADELARTAINQGTVPPPSYPTEQLDIVFERRLHAAVAARTLEVIRERGLDIRDLPTIAQLLVKPTQETVTDFLNVLEAGSKLLSDSKGAFGRFYLLICQHRALSHPFLLRLALSLASPAENWKQIPMQGVIGGLAKFAALGNGWQRISTLVPSSLLRNLEQNQHTITDAQLKTLQQWMAALDVVIQLAAENAGDLIEAIQIYSDSTDDTTKRQAFDRTHRILACIPQQISEEKVIVTDPAILSKFGVRRETLNLQALIRTAYTLDVHLAESTKYRLFLLSPAFILEMRSLSTLGNYIESLPHSEKRIQLAGLLKPSLDAACEAADYPAAAREKLLTELIDALLAHDRAPDGSWVKKVQSGLPTTPMLTRIALPERAPAIWRDDKQPNDTPPEFIKRHYGAWLRADATGLTRPDLKRLDSSLYMALANWLRKNKNKMPEDCHIPLIKERVDAEVSALGLEGIDPHALARIAMARGRRNS